MKEMQELRAGRDKDKELLVGLKTEIGLLRKEKEQSAEETHVWMNEALRPGNKRGCISMTPPEVDNRTRCRVRIMESPSGALRDELKKLKDMEHCTLREVEVLKQRRTAEERRRMEAEAEKLVAEAEVAKLREQIEKLTTEAAAAPTGGTNLKSRLEAATEVGGSAQKTVRRGKPRSTLGRVGSDDGSAVDANDKFSFLQIERKRLRAWKNSGLEALCKQKGITYRTVEMTADEIAEMRVDARFGKKDKETAMKATRLGDEGGGGIPSCSGGTEASTEVEDIPSDSA
ncbi:hypothetical protein CBR_g41309 [Chara braunii]|uniref:Uncharacterized protein n=1 Tax=Chara braunii TaxID=69332 RepID=A0A388LVN4_CHABU|nr:hypothetical protein CBR_g41309 [Chara braunii]|eukprot:GBG86315.1 hypothetical protein CBR_g41309 [Chara braunii]